MAAVYTFIDGVRFADIVGQIFSIDSKGKTGQKVVVREDSC